MLSISNAILRSSLLHTLCWLLIVSLRDQNLKSTELGNCLKFLLKILFLRKIKFQNIFAYLYAPFTIRFRKGWKTSHNSDNTTTTPQALIYSEMLSSIFKPYLNMGNCSLEQNEVYTSSTSKVPMLSSIKSALKTKTVEISLAKLCYFCTLVGTEE